MGIFQQRPCQGKPLLLPAGQIHPSLPQEGFIAVRETLDKSIRTGGSGGLAQLFLCGIRLSPTQILRDGTGKQQRLLGNNGPPPRP